MLIDRHARSDVKLRIIKPHQHSIHAAVAVSGKNNITAPHNGRYIHTIAERQLNAAVTPDVTATIVARCAQLTLVQPEGHPTKYGSGLTEEITVRVLCGNMSSPVPA